MHSSSHDILEETSACTNKAPLVIMADLLMLNWMHKQIYNRPISNSLIELHSMEFKEKVMATIPQSTLDSIRESLFDEELELEFEVYLYVVVQKVWDFAEVNFLEKNNIFLEEVSSNSDGRSIFYGMLPLLHEMGVSAIVCNIDQRVINFMGFWQFHDKDLRPNFLIVSNEDTDITNLRNAIEEQVLLENVKTEDYINWIDVPLSAFYVKSNGANYSENVARPA